MAGKRRGGTVELPLRISLTEEGSDFFIRNRKKLSRFQLADGSEVYGLALQSASIKSMQQMIRQNYISRIEIAQSEFLNRRQQIIDFSKLIMYGLFYRNFDSLVFHRLLKSDLIRQWNRHNPGNPIDEKTRINESFLSSVLANNKAIVDEVKEEILEPVTAQINASPSLLPEEKNIQLLSCERFLQHLQPLTWYILTRYRESVDYPGLVGDIRSRLAHFIEKSKIAEYLALLIMELLANAENSNLNRRASKREKGNCSEKILHSEEFRKSLFEEMARTGKKYILTGISGISTAAVLPENGWKSRYLTEIRSTET